MLFSWIAVEDMLHYSATELLRENKLHKLPTGKLSEQVAAVLHVRGGAPLDVKEFLAMRRIRNSLTHPATVKDEVSLTLDQSRRVFDYCIALVRSLSRDELMIENHREPMTENILKVRKE